MTFRANMVQVIPFKYGRVFKRIFSQPEVFRQFVADALGININVDKIHTEYEYPKPVGFVSSRYDLFAEDTQQRVVVEIQHIKEEDFFHRFLRINLVRTMSERGATTEQISQFTGMDKAEILNINK